MTTRGVIRRLRKAHISRRAADAAVALIKRLQTELDALKAQEAARSIATERLIQEAGEEVVIAEDAIVKADSRQQQK